MKRFVFRLDRLERVRLVGRRQARAALAVAIGEALARQHERETLESRLRQAATAALPADLQDQAWAIRSQALWREGLRAEAADAAGREVAAFDAARAAEAAHATAAREHRVLDRLHGRRKLEWLEELTREEQKSLDELHLLRRGRETETEEA
jgi:hypothetical protein